MSAALDWGDGAYERTAEALAPATDAALTVCQVRAGEHLLDIGTGTGNAALAAAALGAQVVGVDPAARLLEVARERAVERNLAADFRSGSGTAIPAGDAELDAVMSVFGVIFDPDGPATVAELLRVTRPGGRVVLTSWTKGGAIGGAGRLLREAMAAAAPPPDPDRPAGMDWSDPDAVAALFAPHPVTVTTERHELTFRAASPAAWFAEQEDHHPIWRAAHRLLDAAAWADLRERSVEALAAGNEDPSAFAATSTYQILRADLCSRPRPAGASASWTTGPIEVG